METLSARQQQILDFIKSEIKEKGYPPTIPDIAEALGGASYGSVYTHLVRLEKKGFIRRDPTKRRNIEVIEQDNYVQAVQVPIAGCVTAGQPILVQENIEEYFPVPRDKVKNEQVFMLQVKGDSMKKVGIFDGDLILVKKQNTAENGEIVVAMTEEEEATVKRFFKENGHYRLQPENDEYEPIILDHVTILGKVVNVYRRIEESQPNK
jgi:repressor LexA